MRLLGEECAFYQLPRMRLSVVRQAKIPATGGARKVR